MKYNKKYLFIAFLLPVQILLVQILSRNPQFVEQYYSNGLYLYISKLLRLIFKWLPFSFGDTLGIVLLVLLLKEVVKLIRHKFKNFIPKLIKFVAVLSVIYCCFYTFWGLNYFRKPLAESLHLTQSTYTNEQLIKVTKKITNQFNACHMQITKNDTIKVEVPYTTKEIYQKAHFGYDSLAINYPNFTYEIPSVKSSLVSLFQSYNGTSGYINPLTNEAQINSMIPKTGMPATTCHEIAHQIGWAAENEANFIGFLTSIYNKDVYFKYSGYRMAFRYCYIELRKRDKKEAKQVWENVNEGIKKDFINTRKHWQQFENPIEPYFKKGYNSYLKANNQQKGIDSYNYVVDLLISFYEMKN